MKEEEKMNPPTHHVEKSATVAWLFFNQYWRERQSGRQSHAPPRAGNTRSFRTLTVSNDPS